jgi:hypothetical protein
MSCLQLASTYPFLMVPRAVFFLDCVVLRRHCTQLVMHSSQHLSRSLL